MTRDEAFRAVRTGLDLAERWVGREGVRVVALGEMGIGNTTTAVGPGRRADRRGARSRRRPRDGRRRRGPGAASAGRSARLSNATAPRPRDDLGLAGAGRRVRDPRAWPGLAIGAARLRVLVVLDGLISSVAGLIAARLCPAVRGSLVAAHLGPEPGHRVVLDALGLRPLLDLGLRLGEGTGAALALPLIASAADILRDMATFDEAGVSGPAPP